MNAVVLARSPLWRSARSEQAPATLPRIAHVRNHHRVHAARRRGAGRAGFSQVGTGAGLPESRSSADTLTDSLVLQLSAAARVGPLRCYVRDVKPPRMLSVRTAERPLRAWLGRSGRATRGRSPHRPRSRQYEPLQLGARDAGFAVPHRGDLGSGRTARAGLPLAVRVCGAYAHALSLL